MASRLREALLQATVPAPTMLNTHDLAQLMRISESSVTRWARFGTEGFPKPVVSDGTKLRLWLTKDYNSWVAGREQRNSVPMAPRSKHRRAR